MITVKILIDSVDKVKRFSSIVSKGDVDCELIEGVHIIDAKSIMGIFSIDLKKPIQLNIHSDNEEILKKLAEFIVS
jgi:phosphocarrier protein HPr